MTSKKFTIYGFIAIVIWGTSAAITRTLSESLGTFTSAALVNTLAGLFAVSDQFFRRQGFRNLRKIPARYWFWCGLLYIAYIITSYTSVSLAENREQVMIVVLIKFLWPLITLLLTIPILKAKASPWLIGSVAVSIAGIAVANLGGKIQDLPSFTANISHNFLPYFLGLVSALAWGLYSNLARRFIGDKEDGGVGFFILITGLALGAVSLAMNEPRVLTSSMIGGLLYQSIVTTFIATLLWDAAMRKGNIVVVAVASNYLPVVTTIMTALMLEVAISRSMLIGAALVVAGTIWSKRCFQSQEV